MGIKSLVPQLTLNGIVSAIAERPIAISKNNNSWGTGTRLDQIGFSQTYLRRSYRRFIEHGWFEEKPGYRGTGNNEGRTTRFWTTQKFIDHFKDSITIPPVVDKGSNFLYLNKKSGKTKRKVEYKDTPITLSIKNDLTVLNDEFRKHSLTLCAPNSVVPYSFMELIKAGIIKNEIIGINTDYHYKIIFNKTDNIYQNLKKDDFDFKYHNYNIVKNTRKNALLNNISIIALEDLLRVSGKNIRKYFNADIINHIAVKVIELAKSKKDREYFYFPNLELIINDITLTRTFMEIFTLGGRYNHLYQRIPSDLRQHLKIDGEPTVEFDLDACIFQMMCHLEGKDCPEEPYEMLLDKSFDVDNNGVPDIQTLPHKDILSKTIDSAITPFPVNISYLQDNKVDQKKLYKFFQIVLVNATDKSTNSRRSGQINAKESATKAIIKKLNKLGVSGFGKTQIESVIERFKEVHQPIADYLYSDIGRKLQYHESRIANEVLVHFAKKGVMCLCIHDSYRIGESHADELQKIIKQKYCDEFGFTPMISQK